MSQFPQKVHCVWRFSLPSLAIIYGQDKNCNGNLRGNTNWINGTLYAILGMQNTNDHTF